MKWPEDFVNKIHCGDALTILKTFPDECVNCCVTSPPYWGLRNYGVDGQLGLEKTPDCGKRGIMRLRRDLTGKEIEEIIKFFSHS